MQETMAARAHNLKKNMTFGKFEALLTRRFGAFRRRSTRVERESQRLAVVKEEDTEDGIPSLCPSPFSVKPDGVDSNPDCKPPAVESPRKSPPPSQDCKPDAVKSSAVPQPDTVQSTAAPPKSQLRKACARPLPLSKPTRSPSLTKRHSFVEPPSDNDDDSSYGGSLPPPRRSKRKVALANKWTGTLTDPSSSAAITKKHKKTHHSTPPPVPRNLPIYTTLDDVLKHYGPYGIGDDFWNSHDVHRLNGPDLHALQRLVKLDPTDTDGALLWLHIVPAPLPPKSGKRQKKKLAYAESWSSIFFNKQEASSASTGSSQAATCSGSNKSNHSLPTDIPREVAVKTPGKDVMMPYLHPSSADPDVRKAMDMDW